MLKIRQCIIASMENESQNPEFRNNPENFHPCRVDNDNSPSKWLYAVYNYAPVLYYASADRSICSRICLSHHKVHCLSFAIRKCSG